MEMEHQQETNWCWAAVAVSVHNFLNGQPSISQGVLATQVLTRARLITATVDCSQTPGQCNFSASLNDALTVAGNLKSDGFLPSEFLAFDSIKKWVNDDLPVGARIVWFGGGAHFIVIDGYREFESGEQQVHVQDPLHGPSYQSYEDLVKNYPPGGAWMDTYLVAKNGGS